MIKRHEPDLGIALEIEFLVNRSVHFFELFNLSLKELEAISLINYCYTIFFYKMIESQHECYSPEDSLLDLQITSPRRAQTNFTDNLLINYASITDKVSTKNLHRLLHYRIFFQMT